MTSHAMRVQKLRNRLLGGLNTSDLASLGKYHLFKNRVVFYDFEGMRTIDAEYDDVPWPVIWLLARHSPKFIFANNKAPDEKSTIADIDNFINKLKITMPRHGKNYSIVQYVRSVLQNKKKMHACIIMM